MCVEDKKTTKKGKANQSTAKTLATIADNCNNVLDFLQAATVKSPRVTEAPLSLFAYKHARVWFRRWKDITPPPPPAAQAGPTRPHGSHGRPDQPGCPPQKRSAPLSMPSARRKRRPRGGTVSHQRPSASSWRLALPKKPTFRPCRLPQSTTFSTQGMQYPYNTIVN